MPVESVPDIERFPKHPPIPILPVTVRPPYTSSFVTMKFATKTPLLPVTALFHVPDQAGDPVGTVGCGKFGEGGIGGGGIGEDAAGRGARAVPPRSKRAEFIAAAKLMPCCSPRSVPRTIPITSP